MEKNANISIIRVVAMLSIVAGHWCLWKNINLYQFGGIGVEIFLFISGYLYAGKSIENSMEWLQKRFLKLMPAVWIIAIPMLIFYIVNKKIIFAIKNYCLFLFGLSGLSFVFTKIKTEGFEGLGHLWFVTIILMCYLLLILVKQMEGRDVYKRVIGVAKKQPIFFSFICLLITLVIEYLHIQLSYFLQFFTGYYIGKIYDKRKAIKYWSVSLIFSAVIGLFRVFLRNIIDGSIFYDEFLAPVSFNIIAVWMISTMSIVLDLKKETSSNLAKSQLWKHMDEISYFLYVTHYMFLFGPFAVENYVKSSILQNVLFIVLSICAAELLLWLQRWANKMFLLKYKKENRGI